LFFTNVNKPNKDMFWILKRRGGEPMKHDKGGQETYAWNSEDYAAHSGAQYQWAREMIAKLHLKGSESVLDIGCGTGKVTALIGAHLPSGNVTGIDSSADMVAFARKQYPSSGYPNLSFTRMDATNITFSGEFDLAFSNAALHWVPDQVSVLRGVRAALKKPGRIFFQMGGKGNARDILTLLEELVTMDPWRPWFRGFSFPYVFASPDEYKGWLETAGLVPRRLELIPKDMAQEGRNGLAGWIRTTWMPITGRIPEDRRDRFISEIVKMYIKRHPPDINGLIHVPMVRLEVEAEKL
jgi:trans-aconitate 2-methyltransferase